MCNLFEANHLLQEIANAYYASLEVDFVYDSVVAPKGTAPGVVEDTAGRHVVPMQFAMAPIGSKTPTHDKMLLNNARIESIEKWPWKVPFERYRAIVPLTAFREPCYWGEPAGKEVTFRRPDKKPLSVACIYTLWRSQDKQQERYTMSFLMRPASRFVMNSGHHRQPFFIRESGFDAWLDPAKRSADETKAILREHVSTLR